jgi:hypothetical protein
MPIASLRGWNALLLQNATEAARSGHDVLKFVAEQDATPWNTWYLRMLEAEGRLFAGDPLAASDVARDALQLPMTNWFAMAYRDYLAALVLARAGDQKASLALLEPLAQRAPGYAPALIAHNPRVTVPLGSNARFAALRAQIVAGSGAD